MKQRNKFETKLKYVFSLKIMLLMIFNICIDGKITKIEHCELLLKYLVQICSIDGVSSTSRVSHLFSLLERHLVSKMFFVKKQVKSDIFYQKFYTVKL